MKLSGDFLDDGPMKQLEHSHIIRSHKFPAVRSHIPIHKRTNHYSHVEDKPFD